MGVKLGALGLPFVGSTLASIGGNLLGMEADRKEGRREREFAADQAAQNTAMQREFAQHGVRWRVEDAKAAGLHPLYAIGASGASYSPNPITVGSGRSPKGEFFRQTGQDISRALSAQQSPQERAMALLQMDAIRAGIAKDYAQAAYWSSQINRNGQGNGVAQAFPVRDATRGLEAVDIDRIQPKPDEIISMRANEPDITAGRSHPAWREYNMGSFRMIAPINEEGWSEGLESLPLSMWPTFIKRNIEKYGRQWIADFIGIGRRNPKFNLADELPRPGRVPGGRGW